MSSSDQQMADISAQASVTSSGTVSASPPAPPSSQLSGAEAFLAWMVHSISSAPAPIRAQLSQVINPAAQTSTGGALDAFNNSSSSSNTLGTVSTVPVHTVSDSSTSHTVPAIVAPSSPVASSVAPGAPATVISAPHATTPTGSSPTAPAITVHPTPTNSDSSLSKHFSLAQLRAFINSASYSDREGIWSLAASRSDMPDPSLWSPLSSAELTPLYKSLHSEVQSFVLPAHYSINRDTKGVPRPVKEEMEFNFSLYDILLDAIRLCQVEYLTAESSLPRMVPVLLYVLSLIRDRTHSLWLSKTYSRDFIDNYKLITKNGLDEYTVQNLQQAAALTQATRLVSSPSSIPSNRSQQQGHGGQNKRQFENKGRGRGRGHGRGRGQSDRIGDLINEHSQRSPASFNGAGLSN